LRLFLVVLLLVFVVGSVTSGPTQLASVESNGTVITGPAANKIAKDQLSAANRELLASLPPPILDIYQPTMRWLGGRLAGVIADPERFLLILESWGERFAFLSLPMATLLLAVLFITKRQFFAFDHAIFSLHSLSALGLLLTLVFVLDRIIGDTAGWLLLAAPIHLFRHMRGVYGTGAAGTLIRMGLLFIGSVIGFGLIVTGLLAVGLYDMR